MQIQTWLNQATLKLTQTKVASAALDSLILMEYVLEKPREWLLAHNEGTLDAPHLAKLNKLLLQRQRRIPLAYIIGSKEFYGQKFLVNEAVLIPRPESETMIEFLQIVISSESIDTIIDIGTGSGCLAITAKLLYPDIHVTAVDISPAALKVAKKNAGLYKVSIQFKELDFKLGLPAMPETRPYVILANLPYVPAGMVTSTEITKEPELALFSGSDGLDHYKVFWQQVKALKNRPNHIITESLETQHQTLSNLASSSGYHLQTTSDLAQLFSLS